MVNLDRAASFALPIKAEVWPENLRGRSARFSAAGVALTSMGFKTSDLAEGAWTSGSRLRK